MSFVRGMPCSITAAGDEEIYDAPDEIEEVETIKEALINGDSFTLFGKYKTSFSNVVEEELACDDHFTNELRRLLVSEDGSVEFNEALEKLICIAHNKVHCVAQNIYDSIG